MAEFSGLCVVRGISWPNLFSIKCRPTCLNIHQRTRNRQAKPSRHVQRVKQVWLWSTKHLDQDVLVGYVDGKDQYIKYGLGDSTKDIGPKMKATVDFEVVAPNRYAWLVPALLEKKIRQIVVVLFWQTKNHIEEQCIFLLESKERN